jgi:serine/threonine protein phosphatase 1
MLTFSLAPGVLPPNLRVYAVGDVHGCLEQLHKLHEDIIADLTDRPINDARLIHLGDYIDRGPDSAGVVQNLLQLSQLPPLSNLSVTNLMGNHEQMMVLALSDMTGQSDRLWRKNGGDASMRSWGIAPDVMPGFWRHRLPPAHVSWLNNLALSRRLGSYFFVHAGVRPGVALANQKSDDLLWIREPFLSFPGRFGAVVVHGHSPGPNPVVRGNRIGIDTGAVLGGKLSCVVLQDDQMSFLSR